MSLGIALAVLFVLVCLAAVGGHAGDTGAWIFGIGLPYLTVVVFVGGFCLRVARWAKVPVPFRIPTTAGQQRSLSWIKAAALEAPHGTRGVIGRMLLEVLFFRSLLRNTRTEIRRDGDGARVVHNSNLWLWGFALAFHWSLLFIVVRHMRFFTAPMPFFVRWAESLDSIAQIGVPIVYLTDVAILVGLAYLFLRRLVTPQLRYISLPQDYFPLLLIGSIVVSGGLMRYVPHLRVDVTGAKELGTSLATFAFAVPAEPIGVMFYIHLFLVCSLLVYLPFSKLMHMGGVFLSPTRNLANNSREVRHESPWQLDTDPHTYAEYEDEFREKMAGCALPLDEPLVKGDG